METDLPLYRVPDDIAWIDSSELDRGEELYLTRLPDGETVLLEGTARMVWHAAVSTDDPLSEVAALVQRDISEVAAALATFLSQLEAQGFLSPGPA